jgi:hypothetical protein
MATGDSTLLFDGQTSYIEPSVSRFARSTCWPTPPPRRLRRAVKEACQAWPAPWDVWFHISAFGAERVLARLASGSYRSQCEKHMLNSRFTPYDPQRMSAVRCTAAESLQWQAVFWWVCSREMGAAFVDTLRRKITVFFLPPPSFDVV